MSTDNMVILWLDAWTAGNHLYLGYEVLIWQPIMVEKKRPHTWEPDQPECDIRLCHFYAGTEGKLLNFLYKMRIIIL